MSHGNAGIPLIQHRDMMGATKGCWCQVIDAPRVSMPDTQSFSYKAPSSEPVTEEDLKVGWHCAPGLVFRSKQNVKNVAVGCCWQKQDTMTDNANSEIRQRTEHCGPDIVQRWLIGVY